jgi:hypothetical protein
MPRAVPVLGAVVGLVVIVGAGFLLADPGEPEELRENSERADRRPATPRTEDRPAAAVPVPDEPRIDPEEETLLAAWAKAVELHAGGDPLAALALLAPLRKRHPAFFEDPERAALLARMERDALVALDGLIDGGKNIEARKLARTLDGVILDPARRDVLDDRARRIDAKLAGVVRQIENRIIGRTRRGQDKKALLEHIRRFGSTRRGTPGKTVLDRRLADLEKAKSPAELTLPVPDPEAAEKRRLEQLEKLRQRNAIGLLDDIAAGLAWLALHQGADGRISESTVKARCEVLGHAPACGVGKERFPVASTALAVIAFLDFRDQDTKGLFEPALSRGVEWLLKRQRQDGGFPGRLYAHAIAVMALGQAAGSTNREDIREAVRRGLEYLARKPGPVGGYRYALGQPGDLSVSGWVAQAMEAARVGGVEVPPEMTEGLRTFWLAVWRGGSDFAYQTVSNKRPTLAPVGMLTGKILEHPSATKAVVAAWRKSLHAQRTRPNLYSLYYGIRVLLAIDGKLPDRWNTWTREVAKTQTDKGSAAGSFPVKGGLAVWFGETTTYTAYCVLALEHCLYRR